MYVRVVRSFDLMNQGDVLDINVDDPRSMILLSRGYYAPLDEETHDEPVVEMGTMEVEPMEELVEPDGEARS